MLRKLGVTLQLNIYYYMLKLNELAYYMIILRRITEQLQQSRKRAGFLEDGT